MNIICPRDRYLVIPMFLKMMRNIGKTKFLVKPHPEDNWGFYDFIENTYECRRG